MGLGSSKLDVMTDITLPPKSVGILIVEGVAYKDDMTTSVGPGLDVTITVGQIHLRRPKLQRTVPLQPQPLIY